MRSATRGRRQVCLFGTSANPPTGDGGHIGIVQALSHMDRFDEVRVLPVYRHTFSSKRHQLLSYEHRMHMCRLAFMAIPKAVVSDAEQRSFQRLAKGLTETEKGEIRVGTADLMEMLIEEEPDSDFSFCLGTDTFMDLTNWKWRRSRDILRLLEGRLIVFNRKGMPSYNILERIASVNESGDEREDVVLLELSTLKAISSTLARDTRDEEQLLTMVTPQVLEYIKITKLYSFNEENLEMTTR